MDAHRVEVLHVADGDAGVGGVAHHLVFDLFPAEQRALHQHLADRAGCQSSGGDGFELFPVEGGAATGAAEGERRADDQWQADLLRKGFGVLDGVGDYGFGDRLADALQEMLEQLAVFGGADRLDRRAQDLDLVAVQNAAVRELYRQVERGLAAQPRQQRVWPFAVDHQLEKFGGQWLDVGPIRHARVSHDRGWVGVHQDGGVALLAQRAAGLGARVVELRGLADHDRTGADDQNLQGCASSDSPRNSSNSG